MRVDMSQIWTLVSTTEGAEVLNLLCVNMGLALWPALQQKSLSACSCCSMLPHSTSGP
jgi:hypothetical protein